MKRNRSIGAMVMSLLLLTGAAAGARAQGSGASEGAQASSDSTQNSSSQSSPPQGLGAVGQASVQADTTSNGTAAVDTLRARARRSRWIGPFHPVATFRLGASVQSVDLSGALDLPLELLDGFSTTSSYQRGLTEFRQRDRTSNSEKVNTAWQRKFGRLLGFSMRFDRNALHDEERISGNTFVIKSIDQNAEARLGGGGSLLEGMTHTWGVRGRIQDAQSSNRGTDNNRALRFAGASGSLAYDTGAWRATTALGGDRARGDRQLRGKTAPATTSTDTVGATLAYQGPDRLHLDFDARRIIFVEKRLDFPKDELGRVDTLSLDDDNLKVQDEREYRTTREFAVKTGSEVLPGVALDGSYLYDFTETTFRLNRQGLLQRASEGLDLSTTLQHADASSLIVAYGASRDWNDQRQIGSTEFRGKETSQSKRASLTLQQALFAATSLRAVASQELKQFIYSALTNSNDRDELYERLDATVTSQAVPRMTASVRGSANFVRAINIDEALVPNNNQSRTYDIGAGYTWTGIPRVSFHQDYGLSIVFRDFFATDNNDEFNKQGTLTTDATVMLPSKASLSFRHLRDYRKNGRRNVNTASAYNAAQRRIDNQVTVGVSMPIAGFTLKAETRRGRLHDETGLSLDTPTIRNELSGDLRVGISGKRDLLKKKLTVDLKLEHVEAYGPRVRQDERQYLVANTTMTVRF